MQQPLFLVLAACVCLALAGGAGADEKRDLDTLQRSIQKEREEQRSLKARAERLAADRAALRRKLIEAGRKAQEREALVASLEDQLQELEKDATERRDALSRRRGELSGTLQALYGLTRQPPQAFLFYPGPPLKAVRSAILLRESVPTLHRQADRLKIELATLTTVQRDLSDKLERLRQAESALVEERQVLARLIKEKEALEKDTQQAFEATRKRVEALTREARSLQDLVARLNEAPDPAPALPETDDTDTAAVAALTARPEGLRSFPDQGPVNTPVVGKLVQRYGADTGFGQTSKGVVLETGVGASVVAPFDGRVVFSGPFRDHGQILIIEHGGAYHTLLAGLELVNAVVGQWVLAGEPVGAMRMTETAAATATNLGGARPRLYIELRRNGQPVNPLRWIRPSNSKVQEG